MPYLGGYGYGGGLDTGYLWVLVALGLSFLASMWVKSTFAKYSKVPSTKTAAQAARHVLDQNGLQNVRIERVAGNLTDHYDPSANVIRLSDSTYNSKSVGAVGVAVHEVGHAIQHAKGYVPVKIRTAIVPAVNICSRLAVPLMLLGFILDAMGLVKIGILLFSVSLIFALVTLPVEFNASRRAIQTMKADNYFTAEDVEGSKHVLTAAASTYLASAVMSLAQLLRYIGLANRRSSN